MGRLTYEILANSWPSMEGEFADKLTLDAQIRRLYDPRRVP